ncbi:MAG: lipopolysaccharide biosynthesis protein [Burkholderiaceae bacterium]
MPDEFQGRMARGAVWMVLFKFVERGLGLLSTLILVRLLAPSDFGVIAMATSFIAMAELLGAMGFDVALIQQSGATRDHYDTAWTCNLALGLTITLLMLGLASPISTFYQRPDLFWVVVALSFGPLIGAFENVGVVAFRKELDFRKEFNYQVSRKFLGFLVVVPLAFSLRSYWALVAGILCTKAAGTIISYVIQPFRPRLSLARARELFHFSRWLLANNVVGFFKERSSDFFIGRVGGADSLGIYNVAFELANLPTTEISAPINRALLPGFAKLQSPADVEAAYVNAVGLLALLALPLIACLYALAPYIVALILGPKWMAAVPLIEVLAFNGLLLLFQSSMTSVLFARGHPGLVTTANAIYAALLVAGLMWLVYAERSLGVVGAAWAALCASLLTTPLFLYYLWRKLKIAPILFVKAVRRPTLGAAAVVIVLHLALPEYQTAMSTLVSVLHLAWAGPLGLAIYASVVMFMWHLAGRPAGAERLTIEFVRTQVRHGIGGDSPANTT